MEVVTKEINAKDNNSSTSLADVTKEEKPSVSDDKLYKQRQNSLAGRYVRFNDLQ